MEALDAAERVRCCTQCRAIYRSDFLRCPSDGAEIVEVDGDPLVGATIGDHYVVEACIAEGAMGRVYRAHHVRLERKQFAIKVLIGDLASTLAMRLRFAQEAEAASRLEHPNVVSVADYGKSSSGLLYLVMDYVSGPTLSRIIADAGAMEQGRAVTMIRGMLRGLAHAHERGLVHRDFKPDNVIVTLVEGREVPRILDFGLAITAGPSEDAARLTNVGVAVGTPIYAAPEQTSAGTIDQRADLFAVGITLYEMLAGVTPFSGNLAEVLYLNATADLPPIAERAPGVRVAPALERVVRKLANHDPDQRYRSARDVLDALDTVVEAQPEVAPTVKMPAAERRRVDAHRDTAPQAAITRDPEPAKPAARGGVPVSVTIGLGLLSLAIIVGLIVWPRLRAGDGKAERGVIAAIPPAVPIDASVAPAVDVAAPDAAAVVVAEPADAAVAVAVEPSDAADDVDTAERDGREHGGRGHGNAHGSGARSGSSAGTVSTTGGGGGSSAGALPPIDAGVVATRDTPPAPAIDAGVTGDGAGSAKRAPPIDAGDTAVVKPRVVDAKVGIGGIDLHGSASSADVRRAVERALPTIKGCYHTAATRAGKSPAGTAHVTMTIDETGQSRGVKSNGAPLAGLDGCIASALGGLRTRSAPDVGTVSVSLDITLQPEAP